MARKYLEDIVAQVSPRDVERVHLPSARALLQEEGRKAGRVGKSGKDVETPLNLLSSSTKFDKQYPGLVVVQRGMYLMPAGKGGCADACKYKTAGCSAGCLHNTGRQNLINQIARTNTFERDPAAALALLRDEMHTHAENIIKKGAIPSLRIDATSELNLEDKDVGELLWAGPGGKYQKIRKSGPGRGIPMLIGSEYGKQYAKQPLGRPTPKSSQPNVYRVPSWSEHLTRGRAIELINEGHDIALPVTNVRKKDTPERIMMQFGSGEEPLELPVADFDKHDITYLRHNLDKRKTGRAGILREKSPIFGNTRTPGTEAAQARFLREHPVVISPNPRNKGRRA